MSRLLLPLLLLLSLPAAAHAVENAGAGTSLGGGVGAFSPAPGVGGLVALPSLELAAAPGGTDAFQLRVRVPILDIVYNGVVREQLFLQADVFLLKLGQCDCAVGKHKLRPVAGPFLGARFNAGPGVAQPGVRVGGRFGAEYVGPQRRIGLTLAGEPWFEARGGSAGPGRTGASTGGGALIVFAITGYQAP